MYNFICSFLRTVELFQERLNAEQVAAAAGMVTTTHAMITADGQTVAVNYDPATGQYVTPDGQVGKPIVHCNYFQIFHAGCGLQF